MILNALLRYIFLLFLLFGINYSFAYLPIATDSRIKTIVYSPTEIFRLKFHYNYQSYIEFPKNEKFRVISLGDSAAWDIRQVDNRLFIKPKQIAVVTNMTIITNKRPYHFEIVSSKEDLNDIDAELVYVARFYYPDTAYDFLETVKIKKPLEYYNIKPIANTIVSKKEIEEEKKDDKTVEGNKEQVRNNYNYSMVQSSENRENIVPLAVYDNGLYTYFKFNSGILPDIYYVNHNGTEALAKYKVENDTIVVPNLSWQFSVRYNQDVVCIFNENRVN